MYMATDHNQTPHCPMLPFETVVFLAEHCAGRLAATRRLCDLFPDIDCLDVSYSKKYEDQVRLLDGEVVQGLRALRIEVDGGKVCSPEVEFMAPLSDGRPGKRVTNKAYDALMETLYRKVFCATMDAFAFAVDTPGNRDAAATALGLLRGVCAKTLFTCFFEMDAPPLIVFEEGVSGPIASRTTPFGRSIWAALLYVHFVAPMTNPWKPRRYGVFRPTGFTAQVPVFFLEAVFRGLSSSEAVACIVTREALFSSIGRLVATGTVIPQLSVSSCSWSPDFSELLVRVLQHLVHPAPAWEAVDTLDGDNNVVMVMDLIVRCLFCFDASTALQTRTAMAELLLGRLFSHNPWKCTWGVVGGAGTSDTTQRKRTAREQALFVRLLSRAVGSYFLGHDTDRAKAFMAAEAAACARVDCVDAWCGLLPALCMADADAAGADAADAVVEKYATVRAWPLFNLSKFAEHGLLVEGPAVRALESYVAVTLHHLAARPSRSAVELPESLWQFVARHILAVTHGGSSHATYEFAVIGYMRSVGFLAARLCRLCRLSSPSFVLDVLAHILHATERERETGSRVGKNARRTTTTILDGLNGAIRVVVLSCVRAGIPFLHQQCAAVCVAQTERWLGIGRPDSFGVRVAWMCAVVRSALARQKRRVVAGVSKRGRP